MRPEFAELAVCRFEAGGYDIRRTTNFSDQNALVAAEVAKVRIMAPRGGGSRQEELKKIVETDAIVGEDYVDWDLDGTRKAREVEAGGLHGKMSDLKEKCCSVSVEEPADMLTVVALAEQDALFFVKNVSV